MKLQHLWLHSRPWLFQLLRALFREILGRSKVWDRAGEYLCGSLKTGIPRFPEPRVNVSKLNHVYRCNDLNKVGLSATRSILGLQHRALVRISGAPPLLLSESPGGLVRAAGPAPPSGLWFSGSGWRLSRWYWCVSLGCMPCYTLNPAFELM